MTNENNAHSFQINLQMIINLIALNTLQCKDIYFYQ